MMVFKEKGQLILIRHENKTSTINLKKFLLFNS